MKTEPIIPTEKLVRDACKQFSDDIGECALRELFDQYPQNDNLAHVLLKVVALNRIYSTGIFAVYDAAIYIHQQAQDIDSALAIGTSEIVDKIARFPIKTSSKERTFYSFASKYCSWHKPDKYPIWDSRVDRYLRLLKRSLKATEFAVLLGNNPNLWNRYSEFVELMTNLRNHYKLDTFTFKQIDMFIWLSMGESGAKEAGAPLITLSAD